METPRDSRLIRREIYLRARIQSSTMDSRQATARAPSLTPAGNVPASILSMRATDGWRTANGYFAFDIAPLMRGFLICDVSLQFMPNFSGQPFPYVANHSRNSRTLGHGPLAASHFTRLV
ncbi:hypothetical protein BCEN4_140096 [Burkholderia cenocepacia]|nr:hypothetical protein BCEN4_140096 [Burkholderia cenocepacia]